MSGNWYFTEFYAKDKHAEEERHLVPPSYRRALAEIRAQTGPSWRVRLAIAIRLALHRGRVPADPVALPCLLPDGRLGRSTLVFHDGQWALACQVS